MTKEKTKETKKAQPKPEKPDGKLVPNSMRVRATFIAPVLGTAPGDPDIYEKFIGKKSADAEKVKDEIASLPKEELMEDGMTVFHRDENGDPILLPYQIKGFIKEAFQTFCQFGEIKLGKRQKISNYTHKRIVDGFIHVLNENDEIRLQMPEGTEITQNVRPLRGQTQQGERVALACSEQVAKGTVIEFTVEWLNPLLEDAVIAALNYGEKKGIGQWRNSGMGRFKWEKVE
jgi:hypothetical protein